MMERSDTVHTEKKPFGVPAGTMEFTEELDPIQINLNEAALHEVYEEILATREYVAAKHPELSELKKNKFPDLQLDGELTSIHWIKRPNGTVGLNNFHKITSNKTISMEDIFTGFTQAEDANESTGNTKFVDLEASSRKGEDSFIARPRDIIDLKDKTDSETKTKKLDHTGIAALTTAYVSHTRDNFRDFTPSLAALAEEFVKFKILELAQLNFSNKVITQNPNDTTIPERTPYLRITENGELDVSDLKTKNKNPNLSL